MDKKVIISHIKKSLVVFISTVFMGFGISLYLAGGIGSDPFSVMVDGFARRTGLPFGTVSMICNIAITLIFLIFYRKNVKLGSVIAGVFTGFFVNVWTPLFDLLIPDKPHFAVGILLSLGGAIIIGLSVAMYLPCDYGASPIDLTVLWMCDIIKKSYQWGFFIMYGVYLLIGILLGGVWGVGTFISIIVTGPVADKMMIVFDKPIKKLVS